MKTNIIVLIVEVIVVIFYQNIVKSNIFLLKNVTSIH